MIWTPIMNLGQPRSLISNSHDRLALNWFSILTVFVLMTKSFTYTNRAEPSFKKRHLSFKFVLKPKFLRYVFNVRHQNLGLRLNPHTHLMRRNTLPDSSSNLRAFSFELIHPECHTKTPFRRRLLPRPCRFQVSTPERRLLFPTAGNVSS